jgi:hypothetical protein
MNTGVRVLSPALVKAARGDRKPMEIVRNSGGVFSLTSYQQWEEGRNSPTNPFKQAALVLALGVSGFEEISVPYEVPLPAQVIS